MVVNGADNDSDLGIWNYTTSQWEVLDGFTPTGPGNETWTGSINSTSDTISEYLNGDGQITIAFVNADEQDAFSVDYVSVEVTTLPGTSFTSGSFEYTVDDGGSFNDTANVAITGIDNATITGTADDEILVGNDSSSTLNGAGGNDYIIGGAGADTLIGGDGEDILAGGLGLDNLLGNLAGGAGDGDTDTFIIDDTVAVDIIGDFEAGVDQIDLTALLDGITAADGSDLIASDYVNVDTSSGDTVIQVDTNGAAGGTNFVDAVELTGTFAPDEIKILFGDDSGGTGSDTV